MYEPDLWIWKQHQREMLREAELQRLSKTLRKGRKRRASRSSTLAWEARRSASRLLKLLRASKTGANREKGRR